MSKYRYFANIVAQIQFDVVAASEEEADELAVTKLDHARWGEFTETGAELGRYTDDSDWVEVLRYGDM